MNSRLAAPKLALLATITALAMGKPAAADDFKIGDMAVARQFAVPACPTNSDMDVMRELIRKGDEEAGEKLMLQRNCRWIKPQTELSIEDTSPRYATVCVRERDEPACVLTFGSMLHRRGTL